MKKIPLTQGKFALVDDEDYKWLSQWKWQLQKNNKNSYARRMGYSEDHTKRMCISMHRQIMNPPDKNKRIVIDHINHNGLDNQKSNLRICTQKQNTQNKKFFNNTSSKYKGVYFFKNLGKWRASIKTNGKSLHLGIYANEKDAAKAYDKKAYELFGEFAWLNYDNFSELNEKILGA